MTVNQGRRTIRRRPSALFVLIVSAVLLVGALTAAAVAEFWTGKPYPEADPDAVASRLKARSQVAYDGFGLRGRPSVAQGRMNTGSCYYRGLQSIGHIDEARPDVVSFEHTWSVPDVQEDSARPAERRLRERLTGEGWKLTHDRHREARGSLDLGFRFEDPKSGDKIDVAWHDSTATLFVSVYAECGQVPDGFETSGEWTAAWTPAEQG